MSKLVKSLSTVAKDYLIQHKENQLKCMCTETVYINYSSINIDVSFYLKVYENGLKKKKKVLHSFKLWQTHGEYSAILKNRDETVVLCRVFI